MQKDALAVGDSTQLEIIFSTGMYSNRVTKTPRITTNEGPPDKMVKITCDVVARPDSTYPIVIKPYKVDLSQFGDKERTEVKFTIQNVSDKSIAPVLVSSASDYVTVKLPKSIPAGKTAEAVIKIKKEAEAKPFNKSITLQLNDEKSSRFTIPITRTIRGAAGANPAIAQPVPPSH
ncbi:MAG: DUF1573 domain-containing protein [Candidatus Zixiibacteriota bacterium]